MGAFAGDSFVFRRAFSRYGGHGFVGAVDLGRIDAHPQAVRHAVCSDERARKARRREGLSPPHHRRPHHRGALCAIDRKRSASITTCPRCCTRSAGRWRKSAGTSRPGGTDQPLFVMTRPLDLHIGNIASAKVPPGESYPGFHGPYAARVRQIDACFGELVEHAEAPASVRQQHHRDHVGSWRFAWRRAAMGTRIHGFSGSAENSAHHPSAARASPADVGRPGPRELFDRYHTDVVRAAWRVHPGSTGRAAHGSF